MKKIVKVLAVLMALVFAVGMLAACGKKDSGTKSSNKIKAGLICIHDENSTYDLNFINAFKEACEEEGVEYLIMYNKGEDQTCYEAAADLVDKGCNFVFADSFGHEDYIIQAAKEFTDVQFGHATGVKAHTEKLPNYANAFASIYEGRYLAGIAAGMKLNEMIAEGKITPAQAKMGYVGAYTYAEVISGYTSFYLGAKSVCPTVTMEVTFTGSWFDPTLEQEGAETLIKNGCVLISQHADSLGAPTACENAGVPNVSYNGSTMSAGRNTYIVSSRIDWTPYFKHCFDCLRNGKEIEKDWSGTLESGSVLLTDDLNEAVAAQWTQQALDEAKEKIIAGEIHVFDTNTFTVTNIVIDPDTNTFINANAVTDKNGKLISYQADVDDMGDYVGDTEVVADGYFHESEYRSAPYFDLQIDGITLLNSVL